MQPVIPCPKCDGNGYVEMPEGLRQTLALLERHPGSTAPELARWTKGVTVTAVNNRLEHLRMQGYARRHRKGHAWAYFAK